MSLVEDQSRTQETVAIKLRERHFPMKNTTYGAVQTLPLPILVASSTLSDGMTVSKPACPQRLMLLRDWAELAPAQ